MQVVRAVQIYLKSVTTTDTLHETLLAFLRVSIATHLQILITGRVLGTNAEENCSTHVLCLLHLYFSSYSRPVNEENAKERGKF
jgi:hypothetical protein